MLQSVSSVLRTVIIWYLMYPVCDIDTVAYCNFITVDRNWSINVLLSDLSEYVHEGNIWKNGFTVLFFVRYVAQGHQSYVFSVIYLQ